MRGTEYIFGGVKRFIEKNGNERRCVNRNRSVSEKYEKACLWNVEVEEIMDKMNCTKGNDCSKKGLEKYVVSCTGKEKDNCKELSKRARNS